MMTKITLWSLAVALTVLPTAYFFLRWQDQSFRDGAMGNWFGTVVG